MKILLTGGLGYVGSYLTEYFCNRGAEVIVLSKSTDKHLDGLNYRFIQADITDAEDLRKKLTENFDYCIHTASVNDSFVDDYPQKALKVNAMGTRNLIDTLINRNLEKFIYFSTVHVYGVREGKIDESIIPNPRNDYAISHLFGEYYTKQFHQTHQLPYVILRLTNSYGAPRQLNSTKWYLVLNDLAKMAYENKEIVLTSNGQASRDFIWMDDVCQIIEQILLSKNAVNETFNIGSERSYKIIEIANMVKKVYEQEYGEVIGIKINEQDRNAYKETQVDCNKLKYFIPYSIHDQFHEEILKIFHLLDAQPKNERIPPTAKR